MEPERNRVVGHGPHIGRVRVGYVNNRVIRKRKCRRITRIEPTKCGRVVRIKPRVPLPLPPQDVSMALQQLFVSCRDVFKGPGTVPLPLDVQKLCRILDDMKAEDVGLIPDLQFIDPNTQLMAGTPRVACTTIYKCNNFSMCIFFIPAKGVIPLHNHPGMTVFSKLLLGKMHIKSYDLVHPDHPPAFPISPINSQLRLAKLKADSVFTAPCETSVLYPTTGGNIHAFTAITPCAVLDVLGPPYSKEDGRDCSYYKEHPFSSFSNKETGHVSEGEGGDECYGWLEEIEMPENSQMDGIEYLGPQVMDTTTTY